MIRLDFQNLFHSEAISQEDFQAQSSVLTSFLKQFKTREQGFYKIVDNPAIQQKILEFAETKKGQYDHIVVCGIGGSALGAITVRDALYRNQKPTPKLYVLDNIDPDWITEIYQNLQLSRTLFIIISKSGGTAETLSQYLFFQDQIQKAGLPEKDHFVFVTGQNGLLYEKAQQKNIPLFSVPENVGGRFSVLTNVGLLPSALIGVKINDLMAGAQSMRDIFLSEAFEKNLCFQLAAAQFLTYQNGYQTHVMMPYSSRLKSFADWFKQLLAESTGKLNTHHKSVGITPLSALGVTDQHSLLQLLAEGPKDKMITFLALDEFEHHVPITETKPENSTWQLFENKTFADLVQAEFLGTRDALTESKRPNMTIHIPQLSGETLGQLFFLFEGATAFLGEFLEINAFNQPGVERSKVLAKEYLKNQL